MDYWINMAALIGIQVILAFSFYAVFRVGVFAFSTATFMGLGAYGSALVSTKLHLPYPAALLAGIVTAAVMGCVLGMVLLGRVKGFFLAVATLAVGQALVSLYMQWDVVGGVVGIRGIPLSTNIWWVLAACAVVFFLFYQIDRSVIGRILWAANDDHLAAEVSTIDVRSLQLVFFTMSGAIGGLGGALYSHYLGNITPHDFTLAVNMNALLAVLLGGQYTIIGPVLGSAIVVLLPELLRDTGINRFLLYGLLLILIMIFRTEGILGTGRGGSVDSLKPDAGRPASAGLSATDSGDIARDARQHRSASQ